MSEPKKFIVVAVNGEVRSDWIQVGDTITFGEGIIKPLSLWQRIMAKLRKIIVI